LHFFALQVIPSVFRSFFTVTCGSGQYKGPKYPSHPYPLSLKLSLFSLARRQAKEAATLARRHGALARAVAAVEAATAGVEE